jgi:hypothetical protein
MELDYGGGVPACWRSERGGGVVYELRRGDVVRVVHLPRAGNDWSGRSAVSRSGSGGRAHRRCGPATWVRGNRFELVRELQWVTAVLVGH